MGNYKHGSDIDLAVKGEILTDSDILEVNNLLNEKLPIPYYVDVLHYDALSNEE